MEAEFRFDERSSILPNVRRVSDRKFLSLSVLTQLTLIKTSQPNLRDKLTALEAQLTCQLPTEANKAELSPVLGRLDREEEDGVRSKDSVNIQKDCGDDNICIPDLKIFHSR